jgi:hypothetical protein
LTGRKLTSPRTNAMPSGASCSHEPNRTIKVCLRWPDFGPGLPRRSRSAAARARSARS